MRVLHPPLDDIVVLKLGSRLTGRGPAMWQVVAIRYLRRAKNRGSGGEARCNTAVHITMCGLVCGRGRGYIPKPRLCFRMRKHARGTRTLLLTVLQGGAHEGCCVAYAGCGVDAP